MVRRTGVAATLSGFEAGGGEATPAAPAGAADGAVGGGASAGPPAVAAPGSDWLLVTPAAEAAVATCWVCTIAFKSCPEPTVWPAAHP